MNNEAVEDGGLLLGGSKTQQVVHFNKFLKSKHNISIKDLDNVVPVDLKQWITDNYQEPLGLVSAFLCEEWEEHLIMPEILY